MPVIRTILLTALAIWLMIHIVCFVAIVIIVVAEDLYYGHGERGE